MQRSGAPRLLPANCSLVQGRLDSCRPTEAFDLWHKKERTECRMTWNSYCRRCWLRTDSLSEFFCNINRNPQCKQVGIRHKAPRPWRGVPENRNLTTCLTRANGATLEALFFLLPPFAASRNR